MNTGCVSRRVLFFLSLISILALPMGCGSDFFSSSGTAKMTVRLVDAPIQGYKEININITEVRICQESETDTETGKTTEDSTDDGTWITLATPNRTVNLLDLTGGVSSMLADNVTIPAGHYGQMRLILGAGNTVKLADDSIHDLTVPSGLQSGIKLVVNFDVAPGTTKDVFIDFDAANSIKLHKTGHSDKYILRPTVRAFDKVMTGSISGKFTDSATGEPLVGAVVTAQIFDTAGNASIVRSTTTGSDGNYLLDLLPVGGTYYVVSQPVIGTTVYGAKASEAINVTAENATAVYDAAFTATVSASSVAGGVAPEAGEEQSDTVFLIQALSAGGSSHDFIVQTATPVVADSVETYAFAAVPPGSYTVMAVRATQNSDGTTTYQNSPAISVLMADPVAPVTADVGF